ncbi:alpha-2-macroglobulin-P-like isoform X2 [Homarus americanus]|uniref:alpha-2-macroglobulin-P-like isoform X2 n=1 Tax=Homarus americanus TaxID=6706 RepID=UPI001C4817E6|nr:alpha-2-macroglobulin-P-like isoform X2 [Homarus americanus]
MAGTALLILSMFCVLFDFTSGGYIITTPRQWITGDKSKVCIFLTDNTPASPITVHLTNAKFLEEEEAILPYILLNVPVGQRSWCKEIDVPLTKYHSGRLMVVGQLGGTLVNHTATINLKPTTSITFIQTDKSLYLPGQTVQFRILTISGPFMLVSTEKYPIVWVTTPSDTRVAQWTDVDNSDGLVHLSLQLADEPEQGHYNIHVETVQGTKHFYSFNVQEYVLPRFEVEVTTDKYFLATDVHFAFTVCARYTFGQPVKGRVILKVDNNQNRKCLFSTMRTSPISGCKTFQVSAVEVKVVDCQVYLLTAQANVTEDGTGVNLMGKKSVQVFRTAVTLTPVYEDEYMKPNLPFTLQVRAELPDKSPASGEAVEVCAAGKCTVMMTPEDGILTVVLPSYNSKKLFMKTLNCRADMNEGTFQKYMKHYYSPSNSSLLIYAPETQLDCVSGQPRQHILTVLFSATGQPTATITIQVVVWYTRQDGEIVSDARELTVEKCLANPVDLTWGATEVQPGDNAVFTLSSEPNSLCSLGVVDKSTELLSVRKDPITLDTLFDYVDVYKIYPWINSQVNDYLYCRDQFNVLLPVLQPGESIAILPPFRGTDYDYYTNYVDALKMFDDSGLYIFTDLTVETRPCEKEEWQPVVFQTVGIGGMPFEGFDQEIRKKDQDVLASSVSVDSSEDPTTPRTDFPETWLWSLIKQPSSGMTHLEVKLPDTITEWVGKAVCVHQQKSIGLSPVASITTFTPFFLDLTLPSSVKRGEILPVKISVFNYLNYDLPVTVELESNSGYKILEEPGRGRRGQRLSCLAAQEKVVHTIKIDFVELGDVDLIVSAFVDHNSPLQCDTGHGDVSRSDALIKPIKVEAEGFPKEKTWTKYICSEELESKEDFLESWEVAGPSVIVNGSERAWVNVVGDLLGPTLENLGSLIRMSYGCGEQNMINFAPNIFILQYLEVSQQNTPEVLKKLTTLMNTGYQRQLLYRRGDGSFSAFGNADPSGSTWLTAFVLKSFAQARQYIIIDESGLDETSAWLKMKQGKNGCFLSVGKVIHKDMKGGIEGTESAVPLTAYVVISLLEAGNNPSDPEVSEALQCLGDSKTTINAYILSLKAYALALAHHSDAPQVLQQLLNQAVVQSNSVYWKLPHGPGRGLGLEVETAGYAVLAMVTLDVNKYRIQARKVIKWITAQRNGRGGFYSTQDTVVALQALAVYETSQHQGPLNVNVAVTAAGLLHTFSITESNKLLQQTIEFPSLPTIVSVDMEGQGCVVLQVVLRYNIPIPEQGTAFSLTVKTRTEPDVACVTKVITVCAGYHLADGSSNMAVIEVNMVSGYIPMKVDLNEVVKESNIIKKYEVAGNLVSLYLDELTATKTCLEFRLVRDVEVENVKPGTVVVFDYYQPEFSLSKSYSLPPADECR